MRLPPSIPTWVAQLELGGSSRLEGIVDGQPRSHHRQARVLVRLHNSPIAFVTVPIGDHSSLADDVRCIAYSQHGPAIRSHIEADGIAAAAELPRSLPDQREVTCRERFDGATAPGISVVVCTRDRPEQLRQCLPRLAKLHYCNFEVVVVDNAPRNAGTRAVFAELVGDDDRFRYVVEPLPGLSRARNRGLADARHDLVAFTDDDALVDPGWLSAIATGFLRDAEVGCVTGLIAPAELENAAQQYFDRHAGWPSELAFRLFDLGDYSQPAPSYPFSAGVFGAGANFAVDRMFVLRLGGFDALLGAGTSAGGGEDLDLFVRVLFGGRRIAYAPSALVWHVHRATDAELSHQLRSWGSGLAAYITKQLIEPATRTELLRRVPGTFLQIAHAWWRAAASGEITTGGAPLSAAETRGFAIGIFMYARSRRRRTRTSE